ncbi:hypothetical protein AB0M12_43940, partial [Nocardia vinacea]|uniref:hypothetical protein n=1 Tax=Nocardia vinacea TaxID=96468 RepID=UPI00342602DC
MRAQRIGLFAGDCGFAGCLAFRWFGGWSLDFVLAGLLVGSVGVWLGVGCEGAVGFLGVFVGVLGVFEDEGFGVGGVGV